MRILVAEHQTIISLLYSMRISTYPRRGSRGGARGARPPPIFGLAVPNLSPTLHARTPMTPPAPPLFSNPRSAPVILNGNAKKKTNPTFNYRGVRLSVFAGVRQDIRMDAVSRHPSGRACAVVENRLSTCDG